MSYAELDGHPKKHSLMATAFTLDRGIEDGEYMRQCDPAYHKELEKVVEPIRKARGA